MHSFDKPTSNTLNTLNTSTHTLATLILAAGESKRFMECKQLATDKEGQSILERSIANCKAAHLGPIYVVLGARAEKIQLQLESTKSLTLEDVHFIINPGWKNGMGASLSYGVKSIVQSHAHLAGILVVLADQVAVTATELKTLAERFLAQQLTPVASYYNDTLGPPCCFPAQLLGALVSLGSHKGAKEILYEHGAIHIPCPNAAIDIDTADQWEQWLLQENKEHVE